MLIINHRRKQQFAAIALSIEDLHYLMIIPKVYPLLTFHCTGSWMGHIGTLIRNLHKTCVLSLRPEINGLLFWRRYTPHLSSMRASVSLFTETPFNHIPWASHWQWNWGINYKDCGTATFAVVIPGSVLSVFIWCCCSAFKSKYHEQMCAMLHNPALGMNWYQEQQCSTGKLQCEPTSW